METSITPVDTAISPQIQHSIHEATGELFDKIAKSLRDITAPTAIPQPQGFYVDPFALLDSVGMGYRTNPTRVTHETLRQMTEQDTLVGAIVGTRCMQLSTFCQEQENKYSVGNQVRFKDKDKRNRRMTNGERDRVKRVSHYIQNMGQEKNITRPDLEGAMKMMTRDSLTYDQLNVENVYNRGGKLYETLVMDPSTVRIADQSKTNPKGHPIAKAKEKSHVAYVQMINGEILRDFTPATLGFGIRNPRSSLKVGGYGFPECQILIQTVTAHIWAEEWNRAAFSKGSTIKGVLNMKGNIDRAKYDAFKRQWQAQVGGIMNAWKTPIINSDGIEFMPMQMSNTEMGYQMWIEYLVKVATAIYNMDPSEINFDLRGSAGGQQPVFMGNNEAAQKLSKDRGLKPLLRFFEKFINRNIVDRIDDEFEFALVGMDAKSEEQSMELRQKQGQTHITINELRALDDLGPVKYGNVVANPVYIQYLQTKEMAEQQGGMGGQPQMSGQPGQEEEQPAEQPYSNRFGSAGDKPSPTSKDAGQRLGAMAQGSKPQDESEHEEDDNIRFLKQNDWESSVHSSVRNNDLYKGGPGSGPKVSFGIKHQKGSNGTHYVHVNAFVHHPEHGKMLAGGAVFSKQKGKTLLPETVNVFKEWRGRGIGSGIYREAEKHTGHKIVASADQTAAGRGFSNKYIKKSLDLDFFEIELN